MELPGAVWSCPDHPGAIRTPKGHLILVSMQIRIRPAGRGLRGLESHSGSAGDLKGPQTLSR